MAPKSISIAKASPAKMKDVAERAGVSLMTVSLALRTNGDAERISPETRERVLRAAHELRYSPNTRARVLRSGVTNVIGLYGGFGQVNVRMPFFTEIVSGLQESCERHQQDLLLHSTFGSRSITTIYNELRDGRIDGLIVNMPPGDPLSTLLAQAHFPVVAVADFLPGLPSVAVDDRGGSRLLAQHLWDKGHRRCLYFTSPSNASSRVRRREAFLEFAAEQGMSVETMAPVDGEDVMQRWRSLAPSKRPTVVVCWNDSAAYDFLARCRQHGVRVPDDVAVVGFDGCPTPYDSLWGLTTICAPWARVAQLAVEHLNSLIQGHSVPEETTLPVEIVVGHTT